MAAGHRPFPTLQALLDTTRIDKEGGLDTRRVSTAKPLSIWLKRASSNDRLTAMRLPAGQ
jgi:hypothetical protein